jgi:hypothetical protein
MASISVPMDHYLTMTVIRQSVVAEIEAGNQQFGPGKRVAGVYASRTGSLLACDYSSLFIEDDYRSRITMPCCISIDYMVLRDRSSHRLRMIEVVGVNNI